MNLTTPLRFSLNTIVIAYTLTTPINVFSDVVDLEDKNIKHITFKRIKANDVEIKNSSLTIRVDKSASFLLVPFKNVINVNKVSFQWKKKGSINVRDAQHEETKKGDDAYMRVGLMIEGEASLMNPLAPKWVKTVRETLHHSSERMIYLTPGSRHQNGQRWKSPFSNNIEIIAVASKLNPDGWNLSEYTFQTPQRVVGLWLMADGDNTDSSFSSELKALSLN